MIKLTNHAKDRLAAYGIERAWVDAAVLRPTRTEPDPRGQGITRSFIRISARGGRVLRVAHRPDGADVLVLSVHFDRGAQL